jgi:hypothetical protein
VIVNGLTVDMAIWACRLHGKVPNTTVYYRVKVARKKGTYNDEIRRSDEKRIGVVIDLLMTAVACRPYRQSP